MNPAMVLAFVFGLALIWVDGTSVRGWGFLAKPWMLTKLAGVVFLIGWHPIWPARARSSPRDATAAPNGSGA